MNKTKAGFTLIELLVVVLIIAVLASTALPQYQKAVRKARRSQIVSIFDTLSKSIDMYLLENGTPFSMIWFTGPTRNTLINIPSWTSCQVNNCYIHEDGSYWSAYCDTDVCTIWLWDSPLFSSRATSIRLQRTPNNPKWLFGLYNNANASKEFCMFIYDVYGIEKMNDTLKDKCAQLGII
ncbi:MAG: prepilin-type N-terminal cleavage/methylation domain-containing protein [Elusimicrobiaceae bacterium]|nr:prepilin-type N-terminal cleavage/methylation domain-containing protein [Elusimicrobiaceae bacterium]